MAITIDPCTAATTAIEARFRGVKLATGTGFYWQAGDRKFLITNWHVVTGRHPITGAHLSNHAGEPDELRVDIVSNRNLNQRVPHAVPLFDREGVPRWLEHPHWRSSVDVVCLPLFGLDNDIYCLNELNAVEAAKFVGAEVFVVGFPRNIGPDRCAIWKRASIASEPDINVDGVPLMLVDTASASGMSGAPVIQRFRGQAQLKDGGQMMGVNGYQILGVYSGRFAGKNEAEVSLGRVWKAHLIDEMIGSTEVGSREPRGVLPTFVPINYTSGNIKV